MADNDIKIAITGSAEQFAAVLDQVKEHVGELGGGIGGMAAGAVAAFAAVVLEIGDAVVEFAKAEQASNSLTQALATQGLDISDLTDKYKEQAEALSLSTGASQTAITQGQAVLQNYLGQKEITDELTQAVLDFAAANRIDVTEAFQLFGKTIGTTHDALARYGVDLGDAVTRSDRLAKVVEITEQRFGGQAAAANTGVGSIRGLKAAFEELQVHLGSLFAPIVEKIIGSLTRLARVADGVIKQFASGKPEIKDYSDEISGLREKIKTLTDQINNPDLRPKGFWSFSVENAKVEITQIQTHLSQIEKLQEQFEATQVQKVKASTVEKERRAQEQREVEAQAAHNEVLRLQSIGAEQDRIRLVEDEARTLDRINNSKHGFEKNQLLAHLEDLRAVKKKYYDFDKEDDEEQKEEFLAAREAKFQNAIDQQDLFANESIVHSKEYDSLSREEQLAFLSENEDALTSSLKTERDVKNDVARQELQDQINFNNELLSNQERFGKLIGTIKTYVNFEAVLSFANQGLGALDSLAQNVAVKTKAETEAANLLSSTFGKIADTILPGIGGLVTQIFSLAAAGPAAVKSAVDQLAQALPEVFSTIINTIPVIFQSVFDVLPGLIQQIINQIPVLVTKILEAVPTLVNGILSSVLTAVTSILENLPEIVINLIAGVDQALTSIITRLPEIVTKLASDAPRIIQTLVEHLPEIVRKLVDLVPDVISALIRALPQLIEALAKTLPFVLATELTIGIIKELPNIIAAFAEEFLKIPQKFLDALLDGFKQVGDIFSHPGKIIGLAQGGVVPPGYPNDTYPALLSSGEMVVPADRAQGFVQGYGAIASGRASGAGAGGAGSGGMRVVIGFDGPESSRVLTARQVEDKALGIYRAVTT